MALLKLFPIITDDSNKSFIPFDDFFRFLKRNDQKARRIDNVRQILKGYETCLFEQIWISFFVVAYN